MNLLKIIGRTKSGVWFFITPSKYLLKVVVFNWNWCKTSTNLKQFFRKYRCIYLAPDSTSATATMCTVASSPNFRTGPKFQRNCIEHLTRNCAFAYLSTHSSHKFSRITGRPALKRAQWWRKSIEKAKGHNCLEGSCKSSIKTPAYWLSPISFRYFWSLSLRN